MSCFRIPVSICSDIDRACAGFWWGDEEEKQRLHWRKWSELCRPKNLGGLGFRDVISFNKALLAKQVWRLIKNPNSLVARVFKAKYFRNSDIMEGKITSSSSYVWRSLCWGREVLHKGLCWRVGDGKKISVFRDAWVAESPASRLLIGSEMRDNDLRVSELIDDDKTWNLELLDGICWPFEKAYILNTPIGERGNVDERVWKFDEKGEYSVKGGYLAEIGYYDSSPWSSTEDRKVWGRMVWSISVPPKVKVFLWRAMNDLIPTELNLLRHHIPTTGLCIFCKYQWATTQHSLLFCDKISHVWKNSSWWYLLKKCRDMDLIDIGTMMWNEEDKESYEIWVMLLWMVWQLLCKWKHENDDDNGCTSDAHARVFWAAFQQAKPTTSLVSVLGMVPGERSWRPPRTGRFRADVDALYDKEKNLFGVGVIVRDAANIIHLAVSRRVAPSASVVGAELKAVIHAITESIKAQISPIEIYTDSFTVARILANPDEAEELLPEEIQDIMEATRDVLVVGVFHAYRSAMRAAHFLAQYAAHISSPSVWTFDFPAWLRDIVSSDFS